MSEDKQNGLREYLESERQQGQVDSEGTFRVDWKKAQQKVRDFAFEEPHQWICRYLQALTLLDNRRLNVQYGRKKLSLQAQPANALPSPEQLLASDSKPALGTFLDALWGADKRDLQVTLSWTDSNSKTWQLELGGGDVKVSPLEAPLKSVHLSVQARSFLSTLARLFWRGQFAAEYRELTQACRTLGFPVFIDTRLCAALEANPRPFPLWSVRFRPSQDGFSITSRYGEGEFESWPTAPSPWPRQTADILIFMRYVEVPKPVTYYWVIDGLPVPVEGGPLTGGPPKPTSCIATQIYISAANSKTDLSGLKVVESYPQAFELINDALRLIASDPPLAFVDQLHRATPELSLMSCFRTVIGQCENIIRKPSMGDTMGAFYREDLMQKVRRAAESRIKGFGKRNSPPGFWDEVRHAFRKEMP